MENSNEKIKTEVEDENCGIEKSDEAENKIKLDDLTTKRICNSRCTICGSDHIAEIHELKKGGMEQRKIIDVMHDKYGVVFSASSLSRHFSNFFDRQMELSAQIVSADLISEATAKSYHTQKTLELLQMAFDQIIKRAQNGSYIFDLADIIKLADLKYKTLVGNDNLNNDILAIFQKATDKYGVNLQQGVLFGRRAEQEPGEQK